jgi:hypothetical protein
MEQFCHLVGNLEQVFGLLLLSSWQHVNDCGQTFFDRPLGVALEADQ